MEWYPLKLTTPVRNHVFGGQHIQEHLGKKNLQPRPVAETWEVSDVEGSGATVKNGDLAGCTLRELTLEYPDEVVGQGWKGPHFPLLTKFIDGSGMLPVHLHADDETARRKHKQPNGKTEAWYMLWVAPGTTILAGVKEGITKDELRAALLRQDYDAVMSRVEVKMGDTVYMPAGVLHSFGPDTLIYEIEQTSNIQQTAMPWQMENGEPYPKEEWHQNIENLLDEIHMKPQPKPQPGLLIKDGDNQRLFCCAGPYFALERWKLQSSYRHSFQGALILSNIGEGTEVKYKGGTEQLGKAESLLLPAALGEVEIAGGEVLVGYLPDLERDVKAPLRAAGYAEEEIEGFVHEQRVYE
ncbi:type I phosphomannose isomerase catalytic subunit [Pontibacter silvestris]|uniref:Type I phosphomannose isomerase catalytic subunit n=1 Tax=Pontibacter silvestris TaxID=2305183 RepID=A0ABW4X3A6_9BACT|nr:type I phosphomannose isomerase catalytic subunit [Pontibacter silvestris]MCC9135768.1 class I mannose-6-phosphate isomerase [Pontibacter silvestris]